MKYVIATLLVIVPLSGFASYGMEERFDTPSYMDRDQFKSMHDQALGNADDRSNNSEASSRED